MVGILAFSFIIVGARAGGRTLPQRHETHESTESPLTTPVPVLEKANVTVEQNRTHDGPGSANTTEPTSNVTTVTTEPPNVKLDDGHDHHEHLHKIDESVDEQEHDLHEKIGHETESDGSSVLVGVGIFFLFVSISMILYALYLRGYLNSCLPVKRQTYAQQLSRGVIDSGPLNGRH